MQDSKGRVLTMSLQMLDNTPGVSESEERKITE